MTINNHPVSKNIQILIALLLFLSFSASGQTVRHSDWKVIPKDLNDGLERLNFLVGEKFKNDFKSINEREAVEGINFVGLGMQLRNEWKLWKGSDLCQYFLVIGVQEPEDMTRIILTSFHRRLNGRDIDLVRQVELYHDIKNNPDKYYKIPIQRFTVGDTVNSHFYETVFKPSMANRLGRCDLTGVIRDIKVETNEIKIELISVTTTRPDMTYDKGRYREGVQLWETVSGFEWRKKGEVAHIHAGR